MVDFDVGLLSIAAILEKYRHSVEIIDLAWLIRQGRLSVDNNFHTNVARLIIKQGSDVLGFNTRCDTYPFVLNIATRCKKINPRAAIILGGPQATFTDIDTLKAFPCVDIIVRGEGELTIVELMKKLEGKQDLKDINGISYRQDGRIIRNKNRELIRDLDTLPLPAYHLMEKYLSCEDKLLLRNLRIYIQVGRGCPYRCTFCLSSLMYYNQCRIRSPQNIIKEVVFLNRRYKINKFVFGHDHFLVNRKIVKKICNLLLQEKMNIDWVCSSRTDAIDSELLKKMSGSGCKGICFGIESGSMRLQKLIQKNLDLSFTSKLITECRRYNISPRLCFIIGFPEEKSKDINKTLELILKNYVSHEKFIRIKLHLLAAIAGTALFKKNKNRLVFTGFWSDMSEGLTAHLKENLDLIKKFPSLFSNFYIIRPKYLPLSLPYEAVNTFERLIYTYPLSFYIAIKDLHFYPLEFLHKLKKWAERKKLINNKKTGSIFYTKSIMKYFPLFLKNIYVQNNISFTALDYIVKAEKRKCEKCLRKSKEILI